MSITNSIMGRDLARMAREGAAPLIGMGSTDPRVIRELGFLEHNGMTRAQFAERETEWQREAREALALADFNGEPPDGICSVKGLSPKRALYARYFAWRLQVATELASLESKKAELEAIIGSRGQVETEIVNGIRRTANRFLGRGNDSGEGEARDLAERLAVCQHRAEAAKLALPELDQQIETAQLRVKRLEERESEFLHPALIEEADKAGLGKLYLAKIEELRKVVALINGLSEVVATYGSNFMMPLTIKLPPQVGFPSTANTKISDYVISNSERSDIFRQLAQSLKLDPHHRAVVPLPK